MSPRRTGPDGCYCFDRVVKGVGRIQNSSETKKLGEFRQRDALIVRLARKPRLDLLRAFKAGELSMVELVEADRLERLGQVVGDVVVRRPLWDAIELALPKMGRSPRTRARYKNSLDAFAASGILPRAARVADLERVHWPSLEARWGHSAADWNHLGRALSHFLTVALGDRYHPFARTVRERFKPTRRRERHRVPDVTPADFLAIVRKAPRPMQPAYWTIVLTGLRPPGELLALRPEDLLPRTHEVRIRATKTDTDEGDRLVPVATRLWRWIEAAVPCPFTPDALRWHWYKACRLAKRPRIRLYDLRHLAGQTLAEAGRPEAAIARVLGHSSTTTTRKYTDRRLRRADAEAYADELVPLKIPQSRPKGDAR